MKIEVEVMIDGLFGWDSEHGKATDATLAISLGWSTSQNGDFIPVKITGWEYDNGINNLTANRMTQLRYLAEIDLTPYYSSVFSKRGDPVYIRAERMIPMHVGGYSDKIYLTAIRTKQYNVENSEETGELVAAKNINDRIKDKFCRIGVKIKVNKNTQDALDKFNIIASMTGRIWNGTDWSKATEKVPASNPAAVALEVLTGLIHSPSKYEDTEIDLNSFKDLYEFCQDRKVKIDGVTININEGRGLECNGVLTSPVKKIELIKSILGTCEAGLYMDEFGKLSVYYDHAQDTPIALLNPQRLVKLSERRNLGKLADYYDVEFIDQAADWSNTTHEIIRPRVKIKPGENTHSPLKLTFITSYEHAMWLTRRYMAKEILRPGEANAVVGKEGRFYKPGSLIKVQHERFKIGIGSGEVINTIIEEDKIIGLRLMESFFLSEDRDYFVDYYIVDEKRNRVVNTKQIKSTGTYTDTLLFTVSISVDDAPEMGNILSVIDSIRPGVGVTIRESKRYLVADLSENADGYDLTLVQYHDDIYNEQGDIYSIPVYQSSIIQALPREYNSIGDRQTVQEGRIPDPQQIAQQAREQIATTSPSYRGLVTSRPENDNTPIIGDMTANRGDYVMYNGQAGGIWVPARMYQWDGTKWEQLSIAENRWRYLDGINDLTTGAVDGIFSNAFIQTLVANEALINMLFTKNIILNKNGSIESSDYSPNNKGFVIKGDGNAEYNNLKLRGLLDANISLKNGIASPLVGAVRGRLDFGSGFTINNLEWFKSATKTGTYTVMLDLPDSLTTSEKQGLTRRSVLLGYGATVVNNTRIISHYIKRLPVDGYFEVSWKQDSFSDMVEDWFPTNGVILLIY
jgi:hypothetical protein